MELLPICSVAWLIGWALMLEYTIGGSAISRGISPNLVAAHPYIMEWSFYTSRFQYKFGCNLLVSKKPLLLLDLPGFSIICSILKLTTFYALINHSVPTVIFFPFTSLQALLFGSKDSLPAFLSHYYIPFLDITVDPLAAVLIIIVTGFLCLGIKEVTIPFFLLMYL